MQYVNHNILCLEYSELVPAIVSESNYKRLRFVSASITCHGTGGNGRTVFVEFETMPPKYKAKVREMYGDPYEYAAKEPLLKAIEADPKALEFYSSYVLPTGDKLPNSDTDLEGKEQINYVARYTQSAEWLNMLGKLTADKQTLKRELNISLGTFWETVCHLVETKGVALPTNAKRLKGKLADYQANGYESLVETHRWGNNNTAKVKDDTALSVLKALIAKGHDDTVVAMGYNAWAKENSHPSIVPATVTYRRKQWANELVLERQGVGVVASKLSKTIKRARPTAPLLLINSDDNDLDVFFNAEGKSWYRPKLYVVIDAFNDYILGYAWGDSITNELIYEAFRNAHRHVMELTGDAYIWHQLQADRWGISGKNTTELERFYNSMSTFTPAGLKNAASKYIERCFGTTWHQHLKILFGDCYSGHNITAKKQINRDKLDPRNFPSLRNADEMIAAFIKTLRHSTRKGSQLTRQQEWLESFSASDKAKARLLSPELRLDIFGHSHGHTNTITAEGVTPTILGETRTYELTQAQMIKHIGKRVQVKYDPYDLSQVLITDGKGLREVVSEFKLVPSNFADYQPGDAERIKKLQAEKKTLLPTIQAQIEARKETLQRAQIDVESRLKAGLLQKAQRHEDQRLYAASQAGAKGLPAAQNTPEDGGVCAENDTENISYELVENEQKQPKKAVKKDFSIYDRM